jgi:hypothetical protein
LTSSKNNSNQPQQQEINKYESFFPGFTLQQEQYNKVKTSKGKSWPRAESPLEKRYQTFVSDVVNPSNNCFYFPVDENNYSISMPDNGPACRHVVNTIIRIRALNGSEKLYSLGELIGYDGASIRRSMGCNKPETWESIKFGSEKSYNQKTRRFDVYTTGPIGNETKYLLDFNQDNFDKLYQKTWDGKNPYFKPNRRNSNKRVNLICKDESTGIAVDIWWSTLERSVELFKTKSFDELFSGSYLPLAVREERARFSAGLLEEQSKTTPTPSDPASTSTNNTVNNTSAYK